jgi:hypothetical protein
MSVLFHTPTNKGEDVKVSKVIELLSEINPDEEIACSWWEANLFFIGDNNDEQLLADSEEWLKAVAEFDAEGGYDSVNQQVWMNLHYAITEEGEF